MYIKKEIINPLNNRQIGPEAIRFKQIKEIDEDESLILEVEGTICHVGLNFVDLVHKDGRIITVLTDRISKVEWLDKNCQPKFEEHLKATNCRCIEFQRFTQIMRHLECPHCKDKRQGCIELCPHCQNRKDQREHCPKCQNKKQREEQCPHCQDKKQREEQCPHCQDKKQREEQCPHCQDKKQQREQCPHCKGKKQQREQCPHCQNRKDQREHCPHCQNRQRQIEPCPHCQNKRPNHLDPCPHCQNENRNRFIAFNLEHNQNELCQPKFTCFFDHPIPFCDDRFELRLAGLTDDLNFQLLKHKGCKVRFDLS
ncbi:hypothetical protein WQ54_08580 [Bacillus sp. SA1-12]|uniref:hypothetical protein n=1 Tax=Bacillus sp. SA1-12 TaxID=1455638 RepID=UPI000625B7E6|nr:hypothetical protein [Bacillus sp. SA1-12]KKI92656.1 hypothetical protein WQ54_08580 [Bacillus sp. SA1-12]